MAPCEAFGKAPLILTNDAFFSLPLSAVLVGTKTVLLRVDSSHYNSD